MSDTDKLKERYGTDTGFTAPEGYFEELHSRVLDNLPAYPEAPTRAGMSRWERLKPYVYLAAMFAGIWLMMSIFHHAAGLGTLSLDNPPEAIAQAMANASDDLYYSSSPADFRLEAEVSENYADFDDFERDFGYTLSPQYQELDVNAVSLN